MTGIFLQRIQQTKHNEINNKIDTNKKQPYATPKDELGDTFVRQPSTPAQQDVRFGMFGDTEAEKEEKQAKEAYDEAKDKKASATEIERLRLAWRHAEKQAEISKKVKNGVMYAGGIAGSAMGAAVGNHPVAGAAGGSAVSLPVGHYFADIQHAVRTPEFKRGFKKGYDSVDCVIM